MTDILTGARARIMIKGVKVGYASGVRGSESIDQEALKVLDNIETAEFVPTSYDVTLECSLFRIIGDTFKSRGWMPKVGTSPEEHLKNILNSGELVFAIEDNQTNQVTQTFEGVKVASRNFSIDARGIVGENVTFVAKRVRDESET